MMEYDNASLDGNVIFFEKNHKYKFIDDPDQEIISVTTYLKNFHEEFDTKRISKDASMKKGSIYFGMSTGDIQEMWRKKAYKGSSEGTMLHSYSEDIWNGKVTSAPALTKAQWVPQAINDMRTKFGYELAKTELLVYSRVLQIAGQSDMILKKKWGNDENYSYAIYDWKFLSKELEKKSFYNRSTRQYKKMFHPFHHLLDCNWIHYSIQLAIYQTLTGDPSMVKEKVLAIVYDDKYEFVPCYPMRIFWDTNNTLQAVYETFNGKYYDSRVDKILDRWPGDIAGR